MEMEAGTEARTAKKTKIGKAAHDIKQSKVGCNPAQFFTGLVTWACV